MDTSSRGAVATGALFVLLADTLGEPALEAAGQRAYGTAIGIAIAALAFLFWSNPKRGEEAGENRPLAPPESVAR